MKKKVVIFYISKHSGHYHAATAIENGLRELSDGIEVVKINAITHTNPILGRVVNKAYIELIKKKPEIWEHIYDNPEVIERTKTAREALHRFNMSKIRKLIEGESPDMVYCTQAFPCGLVADYKRTLKRCLPLVGVLTDHAPHSYWLYDDVDHYVVPSPGTGKRLREKGVPLEKIRVYGIPVDPRFRKRHEKDQMLREFGLNKGMPTVLIMGGSQGLGAMEEAVLSLASDPFHKYQLAVVTAANKGLYRRLKRYFPFGSGKNVHVFPYVEKIDMLMEAADIIVTKAGGLTTAEAMVKSLPMVIVKPIPGHERMNADYLVSKGAAVEVTDCTELHDTLNGLFDTPGGINNMKENIRAIARPESALDTAALALAG
jgi:processive 1,2-diacylglycerol beta-glucosyltransferase